MQSSQHEPPKPQFIYEPPRRRRSIPWLPIAIIVVAFAVAGAASFVLLWEPLVNFVEAAQLRR